MLGLRLQAYTCWVCRIFGFIHIISSIVLWFPTLDLFQNRVCGMQLMQRGCDFFLRITFQFWEWEMASFFVYVISKISSSSSLTSQRHLISFFFECVQCTLSCFTSGSSMQSLISMMNYFEAIESVKDCHSTDKYETLQIAYALDYGTMMVIFKEYTTLT